MSCKVQSTGLVNTFWEMSQTNRELSCSKMWSRGKKIQTGDAVSAPSMALKTEDSQQVYSVNPTGRGTGKDSEHANIYGSGHINPQICDMEKRRCQIVAPQEELLGADCRVGDSRSLSACATISETARELCKAVSVSLGLTMESSDTTDVDAVLSTCGQLHGEYLFGMEAVTPSRPGAQAAVSDFACPDRDERPLHGHKQLVKMFQSSETAAPFHQLTSTRTSVNAQNFTLCEADDITSQEIDHLDTARSASCPYAGTAPEHMAHFGHTAPERPCRAYNPSDQGGGEFGNATRNRSGAYQQPEELGVKVKSEDGESAWALWGSNYAFNEKYNSQFWGSRQCMNSPAANASFICNPYERSVMRSEQWYPSGMLRTPYPNSSYVKSEVGEWMDVAYTDSR